jgi:hypothetical protein
MICAETADQQILRELYLQIVRPLIRLLHLSPRWATKSPFSARRGEVPSLEQTRLSRRDHLVAAAPR